MGRRYSDWQLANIERGKERRKADRERLKFEDSMLVPERYVFTAPVKCPNCHGTGHTAQRTERNDGVKSQRRTCPCGHRFILVFSEE